MERIDYQMKQDEPHLDKFTRPASSAWRWEMHGRLNGWRARRKAGEGRVADLAVLWPTALCFLRHPNGSFAATQRVRQPANATRTTALPNNYIPRRDSVDERQQCEDRERERGVVWWEIRIQAPRRRNSVFSGSHDGDEEPL